MRIAIIGYGKMGKEIEKIALERQHEITIVINTNNQEDIFSEKFLTSDVAIEFTTPETAYNNVLTCIKSGIPILSGTTGWLNQLNDIKNICIEQNGTFLYSSNYSLGVNIFFHINRKLAQIMNKFANYDIHIEEIHHTQKKDAPSGTAITLVDDIIELIDRKNNWINESETKGDEIGIISKREGMIPGTHIVCYESDIDNISIKHEAKSRKGFALGAVIAAEFIYGKKGVYSMKDVLGI